MAPMKTFVSIMNLLLITLLLSLSSQAIAEDKFGFGFMTENFFGSQVDAASSAEPVGSQSSLSFLSETESATIQALFRSHFPGHFGVGSAIKMKIHEQPNSYAFLGPVFGLDRGRDSAGEMGIFATGGLTFGFNFKIPNLESILFGFEGGLTIGGRRAYTAEKRFSFSSFYTGKSLGFSVHYLQ